MRPRIMDKYSPPLQMRLTRRVRIGDRTYTCGQKVLVYQREDIFGVPFLISADGAEFLTHELAELSALEQMAEAAE